MEFVLNTHTKTLHKPREDQALKITVCGSLMYVSEEHIHRISSYDGQMGETVSQCGRCFEEHGGY